MPSVTRRNQVLKELERVQCEFQNIGRPNLPTVVNLPTCVVELFEQYPYLSFQAKSGLREYFTVKQSAAPSKPDFKDQMADLRDQATLAETEADVKAIFSEVAFIRKGLHTWRDLA